MNVLGELVAELRAFVAGAWWQLSKDDQVLSFLMLRQPGELYP